MEMQLDTEKAQKLDVQNRDIHGECEMQWTQAICSNSVETLRAVFSRDAFLLGTLSQHGWAEHEMLSQALKNPSVPLTMLDAFFGRMGGRFHVSGKARMCVFSLLMKVEAEWLPRMDLENHERRQSRMDAVVTHLVEVVKLPVRMALKYQTSALGESFPLLELASRATARAANSALARYLNH